jgi:hypothetical protein
MTAETRIIHLMQAALDATTRVKITQKVTISRCSAGALKPRVSRYLLHLETPPKMRTR